MYEFPLALGLVPQLAPSATAFADVLMMTGGFWLGIAALTFVSLFPLAVLRRQSDQIDHPTPSEHVDAELPRAA